MDKVLRGVMKYNVVEKAKFVADICNFTNKIVQPESVFISCMDSRVIPQKFINADVGEVFHIRNAGNMVPHYDDYLAGYISTEGGGLELGCVVNNIRNVVVCGHSDCRALYALYDMHAKCDHKLHHHVSPLKTWVALNGRRTAQKFEDIFPEGHCPKDDSNPAFFYVDLGQGVVRATIDPLNHFCVQDKLSQINCLEQAGHVSSYPFLQPFLASGKLKLHAMWFDVFTGNVYLFSQAQRQFVIIDDSSVRSLVEEYNINNSS